MSNVPKLRFSEFDAEWEEKKLKEITKINQGLQIPISERYLEKVSQSLFYITNEFLRKGSEKKYYIKNPPKSVICNENDILMTRTGNTGQVVTNVNGAFHNNFFKIKYDDSLNKDFFVNFLRLRKTQNNILKLAGTSTIPDLNHSDFYKLKIRLPSLNEQQKIANFLTSIDKKIELLESKITHLERYKKGLMQKIFSLELRFRGDDGEVFEDWEEKKLGEVATRKILKNKNSKVIKVLTNSALQGIVSQKDYFDKDIANQNNLEGYYIVDVNDFIYNPRISIHAPVGPIKRNKLSLGIMSPLYTVFRINNVNLDFIEQFFNTSIWYKYMHTIANFGARHDRMNITNIDFLKMPIKIPSLKEQQKIATFLSSIDKKIEQTQKALEEMKAFKKGLLQGMFV